MTRIFKKVQRDKNEEVFEGFWSVEFALTRNYERECDTFTLPHTHTYKNTRLRTETAARLLLKMTTTTTTTSFSSSSSLVSSIRENKKMGKYSNKKIGIPKTRKRPRRGGKSHATVFAFAYDDVFSIVKRPYATREPMSSEDEQIWQRNEEKIIEFVREFHEEVLEAEEKLPRTKAETLVIKAHSSAICCAFGRKRNDNEEYLLAVAIISTDCATVGIVESVMVNASACGNDLLYVENVKRFAVQSACERLYNGDHICDVGARVKYEDAMLFALCDFDDERDGAKYQRFQNGSLGGGKGEALEMMDHVNEDGLREMLDAQK